MSLTRTLVSFARQSQPRRATFSSLAPSAIGSSPACQKFVTALEGYREKNNGQTLHSRFVRDMVRAMDANGDGMISRSELSGLLRNIGATQQQLTKSDLQALVEAFGEGEDEKHISNENVEELILKGALVQ